MLWRVQYDSFYFIYSHLSNIKSVRKLKRQLFELVILQPFLVILSPTTLTSMTIILRCLTSINLNWIKSDHMNYKKIQQLCFSILEEKNWKFKLQKWPGFDYLWSFFLQLYNYLSQNWDPNCHFEVLIVFKS